MGFIGRLLSASPKTQIDNEMKYLITGLGNMGAEYDGTRHNIGFEVLDYIAASKNAEWEHERRGDIARIKHAGRQFILLKPSTYVNLSGKAVSYWMQKENIQVKNTMVVLDDLNLPFGKLRMRPNGSSGGHNGLKSIEAHLNTQNYPRFRIGIGHDFHSGEQSRFVLGKWSNEEKEQLEEIIPNIWKAIVAYSRVGVQKAMSMHNT